MSNKKYGPSILLGAFRPWKEMEDFRKKLLENIVQSFTVPKEIFEASSEDSRYSSSTIALFFLGAKDK